METRAHLLSEKRYDKGPSNGNNSLPSFFKYWERGNESRVVREVLGAVKSEA